MGEHNKNLLKYTNNPQSLLPIYVALIHGQIKYSCCSMGLTPFFIFKRHSKVKEPSLMPEAMPPYGLSALLLLFAEHVVLPSPVQ